MPENPDMQRMQEEAKQRAREMQRRSVLPRPQPQSQAQPPAEAPDKGQRQNMRNRVPQVPLENMGVQKENTRETPAEHEAPADHIGQLETADISPLPSILENLFKDHEKTLILMLLLLIGTGEGQNHEITLALLHLLM